MRKTTNGGVNWLLIPGEGYTDIKFTDSLTGWKCFDSIKKTTNGGINWFTQKFPDIWYYFSSKSCFSVLNSNTVWMVGRQYPSHAPIFKTTNGGLNWGYQIPDTTSQIYSYNYITFISSKVGWSYPMLTTYEIHTTTGGDSTIYMGINNNIISVPKDYILCQNYPNPFNPLTNVKVQMLKQGFAEIKVYDIAGKVIKVILNEKLNSGERNVRFDGSKLGSGIYFYTLFVNGAKIDTKKMVLIK